MTAASTSDDKRYMIFPLDSIKLFAEQSGHDNVAESAMLLLSEDVNYRLREVVNNASQFMKHSNRGKLTCRDINRALKWADSQPVHGHGINCPDKPLSYVESAQVYCEEDPVIDLTKAANDIIESRNRIEVKQNATSCEMFWLCMSGRTNENLVSTRPWPGPSTSAHQV